MLLPALMTSRSHLLLSHQTHPIDDNNNDYQLQWPRCVEYKDEDESASGQSPFVPCSSITERYQDHGHANARGGDTSSFHSAANKAKDLAGVRRTRADPKNDPYQPSRCYPVFWADDEIRLLQLDSASGGSLLHGAFARVRVGSEQAQYEAVSYTWAGE
ncbi:heterokaryon incompatibility protein [Colletotrichum asianum]|uniref:Heterokaryon incompatibility protein n=1 Tax=Colletotrichum asianum TaxID=702518 RepID=A0A8H3ZZ32_9PEZI|nr:heterokaryon incompatibility protein [Colletotrichum asianum]